MARMADPDHPHEDFEDHEQRLEDGGQRSVFSAPWFRGTLILVVLGVVAAIAVPYVLKLGNLPAPKRMILARPETSPLPAPVVPPAVSSPTTMAPAPAMEKPPLVEKPAMTAQPAVTEKPAPLPTIATRADTSTSSAAREATSSRPTKGAASSAPKRPRAYFVQVGAFKSPELAAQLATRLRELNYHVEESSTPGANADPAGAAAPSPSAGDRYDVYLPGGTTADINAKLDAKGLTSEPSAGGVVVRPSLPLQDALALSKYIAVAGLLVQVRRASSAAASVPSAAGIPSGGSDVFHRVRVGPFGSRAAASSALRELEQRGYTPFIARTGPRPSVRT